MKNQWYAGIDVSKDTLDVSVYVEKSKLKDFPHWQFYNTAEGFKEMVSWIKEQGIVLKRTSFVMEYTGYYSWNIRCFLESRKLKYRMEDPLEVRYRSGIGKDKNDRLDSAKLADYLARYSDTLSPSKLPEESLIRLEALQKERKTYVEMRVSLLNRIQVSRYKEEKKRQSRIVEELTKQIETVEEQMRQVIAENEDLKTNYNLLCSIPGISFVNAIDTIVNTENFTSFGSARQYASYVGVAPHSKTSGKCVKWKPKPSRHCDSLAKADLSQAAKAAVEYDKEMNTFYNRKTKNKKDTDTKRKAMNAVKFKLILRMFAVIRRGTPFERLAT